MIRRRLAFIGGVALTWTCVATGLSLLGACFVSYGPCKPHIARRSISDVEQALMQYRIDNNRCPTGNDDLIRGQYIYTAALVDPWGTAIAYSCSLKEEPRARSAGPDRIFDTPDDVTGDF
jgi:hypothetical protein